MRLRLACGLTSGLTLRRVLLRTNRQPTLHRQPHRFGDRHSHDTGFLVHPAVLIQDRVFVLAEIKELVLRELLQPRRGG